MKTLLTYLLLIMSFLYPLRALAGEEAAGSSFSYTINTLVSANAQYPAHSTQNPDNAFLSVYRYSGQLDVRPDFLWEQPWISAVFKPRFTTAYRWWEDGVAKGKTDSPSRAFVNEWRVQAKPLSTLYVSFGKEKLLWGPSFLSTPSNILFRDIEKVNPKAEVEGKYLAKLVYVPNSVLTVNVITETQKEEIVLGGTLKPLRLVKADLLGSNYMVSVIGYHRQDDRFRLGSFGQWTASDAVVLYYDGIVTKGSDALYPAEDKTNPLGASFIKKYDGSERLFATVIGGGSYTFLSGETLSMEFLYNSPGYNDAEARDYYRLRQTAAGHLFDGVLTGPAHQTLAQSLNTGLSFLRRYYVMGQLQFREIKNVLSIILRYTWSAEEHAGQASSIIEWQVSDRVQVFNINTSSVGGNTDTEFSSILAKSFLAGVEVHF